MAKSKEELISMIENDLVDPSTNKITGERVKNALTEMVDAMGTGGGAMEYWAFSEAALLETQSPVFSSLIKFSMGGNVVILPSFVACQILSGYSDIMAIAIDRSLVFYSEGVELTIGDALSSVDFAAAGGVQLTREEFYAV